MVNTVWAAVLEHFLEQSLARLGRVGQSIGLRVQHDIGVARLVGGVAGLELLADEWGRGGDGSAGEDKDGGQLHLE